MAVIAVCPIRDSGATLRVDDRTLRQVFHVTTDSVNTRELEIAEADELPKRGDAWSFGDDSDPSALCTEVQIRRIPRTTKQYMVECRYTTKPSEKAKLEPQNDPSGIPKEISWTSENMQEAFVEDAVQAGVAVKNSAGDPFDPPALRNVAIPVGSLTRYETTFTPQTILDYVNTVNDATFLGGARQTFLMAGINASRVFEEGDGDLFVSELWKVSYTIKYDERTWVYKPLDIGPNYLGDDGEKIRFKTDAEGDYYHGRLDGAGGVLAATADDVFLEFQMYKETDWSVLSLE